MFKIVSESSVAAGVRRIEAITGKKLEDMLYTMEDTIKGMRALFNNAPDLMGTVQKYISEHDGMKKEIEKFQAQAVENVKNQLVSHAETINGIKVVKSVLPMSANGAKDLVFKIRAAIPENLFCVVGTEENGRPLISVMISEDLVKSHNLNAGMLVREAGKLIQGGGGGQPHYATAGGKNPDGLHAAVDKVIELAAL
jgi:alanyl-tRNA synthetase